jgi:hypothetical protein
MSFERALTIAAAIVAACLASGSFAADPSPGADAPRAGKKKMETDEPMSTKMMKPGMRRGDVKKDADERLRRMKPALDREEKSMPR